MALTKTIDFKGIQIQNAYINIDSVTVFPSLAKAEFYVQTMASEGASPIDVKQYSCSYDINGTNPVKQAYEHIKTLMEFSGSEDI